ncbi:hypothetical protein KUTeg_002878 [Tegillarca granosa]|uniref:TRIM56 n=1 Tax=Tegillarca granosa TaxID=220873 RepID=A0ABQ9FQK4_TEGGR|nr:hypothetical protein KUTeg_002878 [Tegillarca granosa]
MATAATDEVESIIKCPICFETYKSPKYLPCSHTTCETCLSQYITSVFKTANTDVNKPKTFPCPICRTEVPVSDPGLSPEDIAAKLPGNHLIVTLLDQSKLKSKDKLCDPCLVLEKHNKAVSWCTVCNEALCTNCDNCHKALKATQKHKVCPLDEIQSETRTITTLEVCSQHEGKKMKLYCMDHNQACCAICVTVHHRKCEHVKTLNDAAKGIKESPEITELTESLKAMIDELSTVLEGRKKNLQDLKRDKQQYLDKISRMRQDINKHLDLLEERVNQELGGSYKEASILIGNDIAEIESSLKVMSNYKNVIDTGLKNVSDIHMFLEMNKIKQQHSKRSELLKKRLEEIKHHAIEIQFEDNWVNLKTKLTNIGTVTINSRPLDVKSGIFGGKGKTNLHSCTSRMIRNFSTTGQLLTDGIFVPNDKLLLADYDGCKVIFCTLEGQVHKELSLSGRPWSIVQIDDREAAVVLDNTQNIQYIDIVNCKLGKLITVNKKLYHAIGYNGTNLIVGGNNGGNIYMIDRTGNIIKTVTSGYYTEYITCTTDRIYLISGYNKLVCLDMNGSQMFSYTNNNFSGGQGISVDKEGNIYCCGNWSNNIHQLTPDGQFIKLIVTDITQPRGISFDKTGERFLVTHGRNNVTVYELQESV